ncbi:MAG: chorismate synthase [Bacteroidetes bacterium]|nr:chorismate synthase [Bacteroidota bacterium]
MNTLGNIFTVTSFGESHGSYVGCVIDGCPAGLKLNIEAIQEQVDRRKTNQSFYTTSRNETDEIEILSGVFENTTSGAPICIVIKNKDAKSKDYDSLRNLYRPNHADFTNEMKYGIRDYLGGGRSSIRVTAPLVAAGEIANQLLQKETKLQTRAFVSQIGELTLSNPYDLTSLNLDSVDESEVRCPDVDLSNKILELLKQVKEEGDTLGGVITCLIQHVPVGLGEPIFGKLQAELGKAMLSINTVKGFEYGYGFASASMKGSEYNDAFMLEKDVIKTSTNRSGGIQGGISNGMDIYFNVAFKPISSIQQKQQSINKQNEIIEFSIDGRHDVCAVPRAVPIVEAYTHIVLADAFLQNKISRL